VLINTGWQTTEARADLLRVAAGRDAFSPSHNKFFVEMLMPRMTDARAFGAITRRP